MNTENTKKMRIFSKAYNDYMSIETVDDLRRNKLSMSDFNMVFDILEKLSKINVDPVCCISEKAANWFKRHHFNVSDPEPDKVEENPLYINYRIGF